MALRSRHRPPFVAQGTWRSGALHVWGWNGTDTASIAWFYSDFRQRSGDGTRIGWHDSPLSYGPIGRLTLSEHGIAAPVSTVELPPLGAAVWLSEVPAGDALSDTLAWFARLSELARATVDRRRLSVAVVDEGPFTAARWVPIVDDTTTDLLAGFDASMPPLCALSDAVDATTIHAQMVDGLARGLLHQTGWKPDLGRKRSADAQATRAVFNALAGADHVIRTGTDEYHDALGQLRVDLDRYHRRLSGEPAIVTRVRLDVPGDPNEPWEVRLELVDESDSTRWCTANDVWERNATALDVARKPEHLDTLVGHLNDAVIAIAPAIPGLADLALEHEPVGVELDVDEVEDFLDEAPAVLHRMGIELLGPERLVRERPRVAGTATPAPIDDRKHGLGREALVEWSVVIDNTPISDTELARATEAGARLLHTGDRWVRIDPDQLRRHRERQLELIHDHSEVGPIELLSLANGDDADADRAMILHRTDSDTTPPADSTGADAGARIDHDLRDWVEELLAGLPDDQLEEATEPAGFRGELRHYQRRGLTWMRRLSELGLGGCLADDMGLGKTATTLAHLADRPGPHLVVCPLSVVRNWSTEAERFAPELDVRIHHGSNRRRNGDHDELFTTDPTNELVVTTYGLLPRDLEHLAAIDWTTVVLDEAQMVKNPHTKAAKAVRQLRATQKLALTGTPVENRLSELWAILDAVNPGMLGSLDGFRRKYAGPIERSRDLDVAGRLRRITDPFVLRRTKADKRLLPDLPDKLEQIAYAKLTKEQATMYQQVVDQLLDEAKDLDGMQRRGVVLRALTRLKQICNHPAHALGDGSRLAGRSGKLNRFDELLTDIFDADEQALVFTQFRQMGDLLVRHLAEQHEMSVPFLHGGVSRTARDRMVDDFQAGTASPLLIVSLKAGGTGLNLTAASQVVHYDRWWNPAVEDQATDRAWRIGQERLVNVHKMVCEGTVEERIGKIIDEKRALADAVVGTSEAWVSELDNDELAELVTLDDAR